MSWLVNSLANSLKLDDDDDNDNDENTIDHQNNDNRPIDQTNLPRGVKDDLSDLSKTFTRNLWAAASFLAPPPPPPSDGRDDGESPPRIAGIRNDLSEIGGKFKSEISKLSSNKAVSEFTKIATSLLHFGDDDDFSVKDYADRGIIGVTDEVVSFARDVSMHPETWLDFPLPIDDDDDDDDDDEDFDLSDAQQEHALAVERLAPELAALRTELCLGYMTEGSFWKIYFVLVHPRLSRHDAVILSTPPIMKARAMLTQELQNRGKSKKSDSRTDDISIDSSETSHEEQLSVPVVDKSEPIAVEILSAEPSPSVKHDVEIDKRPIASVEDPVIEKAVVEEVPVKKSVSEKSTSTTSKSVVCADENDEEEDDDEWLKEETEVSSFKGTSYPLQNVDDDDDDVNFSDLEEDEDVPASYKKVGESSKNPSGSNEASSHTLKNKESNDWLDIEDIEDA